MSHEVPWTSAITKVKKNELVTHGIDQTEIINNFRYEEMVFLLIFGRKPTPVEADLLRAVIVSHCSHGITGQSTLAVRMGADCRAPFLNSALAGFLVGSGAFHQGALQASMNMIKEAAGAENPERYTRDRITSGQILYGYGHRYHSKDPRVIALMKLCEVRDYVGKYVQIARGIERIVGPELGHYMNIEAAGGSILLDMGFPPEVAPLVIFIGRAPMFAAAYMERLRSDSKPFQKIAVYDIVLEEGE